MKYVGVRRIAVAFGMETEQFDRWGSYPSYVQVKWLGRVKQKTKMNLLHNKRMSPVVERVIVI